MKFFFNLIALMMLSMLVACESSNNLADPESPESNGLTNAQQEPASTQ